jgi:hypothetical protein
MTQVLPNLPHDVCFGMLGIMPECHCPLFFLRMAIWLRGLERLVFSARRCCRRSRVRAPVWPGTFLRKNIIILVRVIFMVPNSLKHCITLLMIPEHQPCSGRGQTWFIAMHFQFYNPKFAPSVQHISWILLGNHGHGRFCTIKIIYIVACTACLYCCVAALNSLYLYDCCFHLFPFCLCRVAWRPPVAPRRPRGAWWIAMAHTTSYHRPWSSSDGRSVTSHWR